MSQPYKILFGLIVLLSMSGCVSVKKIPMTADSANQIRNKQITITKRDTPDFGASTPGKAMFGAIGAAAMISAGNQIISQKNIDAARLKQELTQAADFWIREFESKALQI